MNSEAIISAAAKAATPAQLTAGICDLLRDTKRVTDALGPMCEVWLSRKLAAICGEAMSDRSPTRYELNRLITGAQERLQEIAYMRDGLTSAQRVFSEICRALQAEDED